MKLSLPITALWSSRLIRAGAGSFFVRAGYMGLEFATTLVLARYLGANGFGIYSFAYALTRIAALPAQAGLPTLAVREVAKYQAQGEFCKLRGFVSWSAKVVLVFSLLLMSVGMAVAYSHPQVGLPAITLFLALALVPIVALGNLRGGILRGLHRVLLGQLPENIIRPALLVILASAWGLLGRPLSATSAMALHIGAATVAFLWGAWMLKKTVPEEIWSARKEFERAYWLRSLGPLSIFGGMQILNAQLSVLVLGVYRSVDEVGVYRVASQVGLLGGLPQIVINMAVAPVLARMYATNGREQLGELTRRCAKVVFLSTLALCSLLMACGGLLLEIFGGGFSDGYWPLVILAGGQLAASFAGVAMISLNMTGNESLLTRSIGVATAFNLLAHLFFVPEFGVTGAAVVTALSTMLGALLAGRYLWKALNINPFAKLP